MPESLIRYRPQRPKDRERTMEKNLPLEGLRVVDLADEKGELCGRMLGDFGAEVIRVEPPDGARSRRIPPFHDGKSLYFAYRNFNKRGVVLDLDSERDRERLHRLLDAADVRRVSYARLGDLRDRRTHPGEFDRRKGRLQTPALDHFATSPQMHPSVVPRRRLELLQP